MKYQRYISRVTLMASIAAVLLSSPSALTSISTTTPAAAIITPAAYAQTTTDTTTDTTDTTTTVASDTLFVGDLADDTVKSIDIQDHEGQVFIAKNNGSGEGGYRLKSPTGMIVVDDTLLVANQNANTGKRGEILKFNVETGAFEGFLVKNNNRDAPWAPRGIVVSPDGGVLYVASFDARGSTKSDLVPGAILTYDAQTGEFLGSFTPDEEVLPVGTEFHPRGVVFSADDGKLYISGTGDQTSASGLLAGYILTFDPETKKFALFASTENAPDLHRPEGLAFDSEGNLWVTSFRADATDIDRILAFNSEGEQYNTNTIELYKSGEARAYAQAILFGPDCPDGNDGNLFVPISFNTGELRCYDVGTGEYTVVTEAGNPLLAPWYLTFKATDPSTLAYSGN